MAAALDQPLNPQEQQGLQPQTPMATLDLQEQGTIQSSPLSFHESDLDGRETYHTWTPPRAEIRAELKRERQQRRLAALAESLGEDSNAEQEQEQQSLQPHTPMATLDSQVQS